MNFNKIYKKVTNFFILNKKRNKQIFHKRQSTKFKKYRKTFSLTKKHIQKCKLLGNKIINYYIIIFIIIFLIIFYLLFGPVFKVKTIDIIKQDNITNMNISYKAIESFRGDSIFSIEKEGILKKLQNYQNNIKDIQLELSLPSKLKIIVSSYKGLFNTTINNKTYLITANGTLIPSTYSEELKELIISNSFIKNSFLDYKSIFNSQYILEINNIINLLEDNILNLKINNIFYYKTERELHIELNNKTLLIFSLDGKYKKQIEKIAIFNKDFTNINKEGLIYIDLRINNKIFYCTIDNELQCNQNIKKVYPK